MPNGSVRRWAESRLCALAGALAIAVALLFGEAQAAAAEGESQAAVTVAIDGQEVVVDSALVAQVAAALDEFGEDASALQQAIAQIVRTNASGADNQLLAKAILWLAVSRSGQGADTIAAIVAGVETGNGSISAGDLVAALPAEDSSDDGDSSEGSDGDDSSEGADESTASSDNSASAASESLAASENPQQVSPVTM